MAGKVLGGRYAIQDKVGSGGMAVVYRGLDEVLGRTVAIKTMLPQYASDPSFAARFKQEAQAAAALQSPYIVNVYDWGKDGDTYYIVMEYLRGTDLKSGIRKHGALDCRKVAQIGMEISQALSVAHKHDIIHRDIKPQNIMVQPDGNIKVMDFGIARAKNSHLTQDNNVLGTAHYVSPEQTQGKELGPTSDLYSLGIVMYEAATGEVPFKGDDAISVALKQVNEQPVPPSQLNPNVDPQLEAIILKCMQKDPAARFQTADDLSKTLRDYLAGRLAQVNVAVSPGVGATTVTPAGGTTTVLNPGEGATRVQKPVVNRGQRINSSPYDSEVSTTSRGDRHGAGRAIIAFLAAAAVLAAVYFGVSSIVNERNATQQVPNFIGYTEEQATAELEASEFFEVGTNTYEYDEEAPEGEVIGQTPDAGSDQTKGTRVNLVVSKGEEPAKEVQVPNLLNMTPEQAEAELAKKGLVGVAGANVNDDLIEAGHVAKQSPTAGSTAKEGDTVTYQISLGTENVPVPEVIGYYENSAVTMLQEAGFNVAYNAQQYNDYYAAGVVMDASPTGTQPKGTTVYITVSLGPEPSSEPDPGTDTGGDTGGDTSGDTGGNTGGDTGGDTGGETGGDTGGEG